MTVADSHRITGQGTEAELPGLKRSRWFDGRETQPGLTAGIGCGGDLCGREGGSKAALGLLQNCPCPL